MRQQATSKMVPKKAIDQVNGLHRLSPIHYTGTHLACLGGKALPEPRNEAARQESVLSLRA